MQLALRHDTSAYKIEPAAMISLAQNVMRVFRPITVTDHRQRRMWNLVQSAVTNLGNRVLGMAITFFSVPLTIDYLGREQYGAWVSIVGFTAWLALTDFGLGNGLTNAVTTAAGQDRPDLVRMHLSNGLVIMSAIGGVLALAAALVWRYVDWADVFGVHTPEAREEIAPAVAVVLGVFILNMPLSMVGKVYQAYQQGRIGNYWGMSGNVLGFAALIVVTRTHGGLVWLAAAVSATPLALSAASNLYVFVWHNPELRPHWRYADLPAMRTLGKVGGSFLMIQVTSLMVFQTDNLVIDRFLGASHVPQYNLTYSLFTYTTLPLSVIFSYMWAAYTEAIARKDIIWVRRAFQIHLWGGTLFAIAASGVLITVARPFIAWWAGEDVVPDVQLVWWMATWAVINGFTNPIACLLAAASHLKMQTVFSAFAAVVNLALSIFLVQRIGTTGVIAGTVMTYAVFICGPIYLVCRRFVGDLDRAV